MTIWTLRIAITFILATAAMAQVTAPKPLPTNRSTTTGSTESRQFEYLVVSFGKIYFSDPITETDVKTSGLSKLISFSKAGMVIANEAVTTEYKLDTLGKFGWELVGVVGAIGGDQELLFKRPYIAGRSKQEEELIKAEGEQAKALFDEERKKASQAVPATVLVDLDEAERLARRDANRKAEEDRFRAAMETTKDYPFTITSLFSRANTGIDSNLQVDIAVDGTQLLLTDGNKYRSGHAARIAEAAAILFFKAARLKQHYSSSYGSESLLYLGGTVGISVTVFVNFNGQKKTVGTKTISGDWP